MSLDVNRCTREVNFVPNDLSKLKSGRCAILWFGDHIDEHIDEIKSGRHCYIHAYDKIRCVWFRLIGKKHTTWQLSHNICNYEMHTWSYLMIMSYWHGNIYHLYSHSTSIHFWFLFKFHFLLYCIIAGVECADSILVFAHCLSNTTGVPSCHGGISKTPGVCHGWRNVCKHQNIDTSPLPMARHSSGFGKEPPWCIRWEACRWPPCSKKSMSGLD